jgi:5-oxoprolinase (ATP-hydrolysing)
MVEAYGEGTVRHYMSALKAQAESRIRQALERFTEGTYEATQMLDDGSKLSVRIELAGGNAVIDFAGTSEVQPGNLNATPAVVHSVVLYVLRLLVGEPMPLNEGLMRAVELRIPRGMLNPDFSGDPSESPAIVGGNVETSQRITDTLLKALGVCACSQGTMNNVLFGNDRFSYYETVCGGAGAGPGFKGADAVHTHMTNTRITDPEIIEHRYPVCVEQFAVRRGSGGEGRHRGGDGVVREIRFLESASLSILSQNRKRGPCGLDGGESGEPGRQKVIRASGEIQELGAVDGCEVGPGDRLVLETPGGGACGESE